MRGRVRLPVVLMGVLLVGCGAGGGSGSTGDGAASSETTLTGRCHTSQLQARIESGTPTITVVSLTNTSNDLCVLEGYVRLDLLDGTGAALPVQPTRLTDVPTRRVTLTRGRGASFELHTRQTAAGGPACTMVTPARLRITPPDEPEALTLEAASAPGLAGCDNQYGITAIQPRP